MYTGDNNCISRFGRMFWYLAVHVRMARLLRSVSDRYLSDTCCVWRVSVWCRSEQPYYLGYCGFVICIHSSFQSGWVLKFLNRGLDVSTHLHNKSRAFIEREKNTYGIIRVILQIFTLYLQQIVSKVDLRTYISSIHHRLQECMCIYEYVFNVEVCIKQ